MVLMPHRHHHLPAPQQAKRLPPPAISLRSKSMTSELEEMGELVGLLGPGAGEGEGQKGAEPDLEFVSVVSDKGSSSSTCPLVHGSDSLWPACVSLGRGV